MLKRLRRRGAGTDVFRGDLDPVQRDLSIAGLGYFYVSNRWTLSAVFGRDFIEPEALRARLAHLIDMVLGDLEPPLDGGRRSREAAARSSA